MHIKMKYKKRQFNNKMTALISKPHIKTLFIYIWHGQIIVWMFCLNITMHTEVTIHSLNADPKVHQDFKGQSHYGKVKGHTMTLHTYNPLRMSLPSINFLHLTVSEIWPREDFIGQSHYSKVKSRSHYDTTHLHPLTNVPSINFLHLTVSEIQAGQTSSRCLPAHLDTMGKTIP